MLDVGICLQSHQGLITVAKASLQETVKSGGINQEKQSILSVLSVLSVLSILSILSLLSIVDLEAGSDGGKLAGKSVLSQVGS
jgi:hypothetical protein